MPPFRNKILHIPSGKTPEVCAGKGFSGDNSSDFAKFVQNYADTDTFQEISGKNC